MGFVDDNEVRAGSRKTLAALFGLDVVEADDRMRVRREDALARWEVALEARGVSVECSKAARFGPMPKG